MFYINAASQCFTHFKLLPYRPDSYFSLYCFRLESAFSRASLVSQFRIPLPRSRYSPKIGALNGLRDSSSQTEPGGPQGGLKIL